MLPSHDNQMIHCIYLVIDRMFKHLAIIISPLGEMIQKWKTSKRTKWKSGSKHNVRTTLKTTALSAVLAMSSSTTSYQNRERFNTDSFQIGIDNRCLACISHKVHDFIGDLHDSGWVIKGFGGLRTTNVKCRTILWKWTDSKGEEHKFKIPHSYYVPDGEMRLLSPQHWARSIGQATTAGEDTNGKRTRLYWNGGKNEIEIPLGAHDNVATFETSPGYSRYHAFHTKIEEEVSDDSPKLLAELNVVSDDEDSDSEYEGTPMSRQDHWYPVVLS